MTIDPTTGLPQLPEGYFWKIEPYAVKIKKELPPGKWKECPGEFSLHIHHFRETKKEQQPVKSFFGFRQKYKTVRYCRNKVSRITVFESEYGSASIKPITYADGSTSRILKDMEPTSRINVEERCYETLTRWKAYEERQRLYGEYPPKKLEATNG